MNNLDWQNSTILDELQVSAELRDWLSLTSSMTKHMQSNCNIVKVSVVHNKQDTIYQDEATKLGIDVECPCWIREVIMLCNDKQWLYGRTVIPECSLHGKVKDITQLGSIPLGRILFSDPKTQRDNFEYTYIKAAQLYHQRMQVFIPDVTQDLWARRSIFNYDKKPLLLTELFLPEMTQEINAS